jgi:quercetin dioxygenase-like cupin family protein
MTQALTDTIPVGAMTIRFLVEGQESGGSVSVFECSVPLGAIMPAPHSHDGFEETVYGLDGTTTWTVDGHEHDIGPGQALCIPRGAVHAFDNRQGTDAKFLAIATPGVFGPAYFREIGEVVGAGGPPDPAAIAEVMRRHGLTPALPGGYNCENP